jgi:hypothetical protein
MISWQEFLEQIHPIDERQIDMLYHKAHAAVELVRKIRPDLLDNIATIANLASGAYGVYSSGENKHLLPPDIQTYLVYYGKVNKQNLDKIPKITLLQYYPQIPKDKIRESDTIHVNVRRILAEVKSDLEAILQIGATIVHEATHDTEFQNTGKTSEAGPEAAERDFIQKSQQFLATPEGQKFLQQYGIQRTFGMA